MAAEKMNGRAFFSLLLLGLLALGAAGQKQTHSQTSAQSQTLASVIALIKDKSQTIKSYVADTQDFHIGLLRNNGRLYFKQPFLVRWEDYSTQNALESVFIVNHGGTSFYFLSSNTLYKIQPGRKNKGSLQQLSPVLGIYASGEALEFIGDREVKGISCYVMESTDKTSRNRNLWSIQQAYFSQDTGLLVQLVSQDWRGEVLSKTVFTNYQLNVPIEDDRFSFSPPLDAEIVRSNPGDVLK
jgi:outer membrane lipoprotein-sorting protein